MKRNARKRGGSCVRAYMDLGGEEGGPYKRKVEGNISGMEYPIGDISMSTQE